MFASSASRRPAQHLQVTSGSCSRDAGSGTYPAFRGSYGTFPERPRHMSHVCVVVRQGCAYKGASSLSPSSLSSLAAVNVQHDRRAHVVVHVVLERLPAQDI
ncbi:hypothetical protein PG985_016002 [Apiospora marii]|uniref:uncharacterized protein n=1 Tax=Apiospora marii TaxID=335849 RepID=UPI00312DC193